MKSIDFGKEFNQREYWKYHLQILMGTYGVLKKIGDNLGRIADGLEGTEEVVRVKEESSDPD